MNYMENIGNIEDITREIQHFYPDKIHGAVGYLEARYNLNVFHASHIASVAWQTLNNKNPVSYTHLTQPTTPYV